MNQDIRPFQHFPRARMFTREIIIAAAITLAAFCTFLLPHDASEYASTETPSIKLSPQ